jgi:hypothetical protein
MGLGSGILDLGSGIRKKPSLDTGSRGQKVTGSRIRIRNTASKKFCNSQLGLGNQAVGSVAS